jgi:hypothetical protein
MFKPSIFPWALVRTPHRTQHEMKWPTTVTYDHKCMQLFMENAEFLSDFNQNQKMCLQTSVKIPNTKFHVKIPAPWGWQCLMRTDTHDEAKRSIFATALQTRLKTQLIKFFPSPSWHFLTTKSVQFIYFYTSLLKPYCSTALGQQSILYQ